MHLNAVVGGDNRDPSGILETIECSLSSTKECLLTGNKSSKKEKGIRRDGRPGKKKNCLRPSGGRRKGSPIRSQKTPKEILIRALKGSPRCEEGKEGNNQKP